MGTVSVVSMSASFTFIFSLVLSAAHAQPTPTELLAQQHQQLLQQQQQAASRRVNTRNLPAPCVVPDSWYPLRTCKISSSPQECGRGYNAWPNFAECCQPGTGAHLQGCTDFNKPVQCWIPKDFYPQRTCQLTNNLTRCSFNWGTWDTVDQCCAPGAAFPEGCTAPEPCWVASQWYPSRACSSTNDMQVCMRGWGAFKTQDECCAKGNAFSDGCGDAMQIPSDAQQQLQQTDSQLINNALQGNISVLDVPTSQQPQVMAQDGPSQGSGACSCSCNNHDAHAHANHGHH